MTEIVERFQRIPFRLRLTLSFAALMVVLFGGLALLLYTRFSASLEVPAGSAPPARTPAARAAQQASALSRSQREHALGSLGRLLFIGGPAMLVVTCLAGYLLTARALAPVEKMRRRADRISGTLQGDRLPVPEADDELGRLGTTLNEMLGRLQEAMERERAFVADAGHELRTPLSILKLELEELEQAVTSGSSPEELERGLRSAAEEMERLAKLAEDLLVMARADQGGLPIEKRPVQVERLLRAVADRMGGVSGGERRIVVADSAAGLTVSGDPAWLEQAVGNMLSNALMHGDGTVLLSPRKRDGEVELHVLDEGSGFPPGFLPRAFERFSRADAARSAGGAGLGLLVVRAIAEAHGGSAGAANRAGGGADVWISLPLARAAQRDDQHAAVSNEGVR